MVVKIFLFLSKGANHSLAVIVVVFVVVVVVAVGIVVGNLTCKLSAWISRDQPERDIL